MMEMQQARPDKAFPFLKFIQAKQSQFDLHVPTSFCYSSLTPIELSKGDYRDNVVNRKLFFSELRIVPDFYSQQANQLILDAETELDLPLHQSLKLNVRWSNLLLKEASLAQRPQIALSPAQLDPIHLIRALNDIAVAKQSPHQKFPGIIVDWIRTYEEDPKGQDADDTLTEDDDPFYDLFIKSIPAQARILYGADYDPAVHGISMLPTAMQSFPHANNYAFPQLSGIDKGIRIRISIAPGTSLTFSNIQILRLLGFDSRQIILAGRQFIVANSNKNDWLTLIGIDPPKDVLVAEDIRAAVKLSITYRHNDVLLDSGEVVLPLTRGQFNKPDILGQALAEAVDAVSTRCNVNLSYNPTDKKFIFPPDLEPDVASKLGQLVKLDILLSTTLAKQLGYGPVNIINRLSSVTPPVTAVALNVQAQCLCQDTGIIYITAKHGSSDVLTDYSEQYLCSLEPKAEGIMKLVPPLSFQSTNYFYAPNYFSGSSDVELNFNLYTIFPDGNHVPLGWVTGAYIIGNLRSRL